MLLKVIGEFYSSNMRGWSDADIASDHKCDGCGFDFSPRKWKVSLIVQEEGEGTQYYKNHINVEPLFNLTRISWSI